MSSGESGSKYSAASPQTSGSDVAFDDGDGAAAGHRLERRQAEALVEARKDEAAGEAVEVDETHPVETCPRDFDTRRQRRLVVSGAREHEPELRPLAARERERLEQPRRGSCAASGSPGRGGSGSRGRPSGVKRCVVDAEVDRPDALRVEPVALDQRLSRVLRDRDHDPAALDRPPVDRRGGSASSAREKNSG